MAFFILGDFLVRKILGGGDGNKAIQEVTNAVNLQSITDVLVGNNVTTTFSVFGSQQITLDLNGCTVGDVSVSQLNQTGVEVIQSSQLQLNSQILNELRTDIENTLKNSLEKDVKSLFPAFDAVTEIFRKDLTVEQRLNNELTQIVQTTVTAQNISTIQGNVFNTATLKISCANSFLDSLTINQELVVNATIKNLVSTVVENFINNLLDAQLTNDLEQTLTDSVSQELPLPGGIIAIIVVVVVVAIVLILGLVLAWYFCKIPGLPPPPGGCKSDGTSITINSTPATPDISATSTPSTATPSPTESIT